MTGFVATIAIAAVMAIIDAATAPKYEPIHTVEVPGFTLIMASPDEVKAMAKEHGCKNWERVRGFCKPDERLVVVERTGHMPEDWIVGHEVLHLIYDRYHK